MADAGHNLSDVLGLRLTWGTVILVRKVPNGRNTYGLRSSSILTARTNAMFLYSRSAYSGFEYHRKRLDAVMRTKNILCQAQNGD